MAQTEEIVAKYRLDLDELKTQVNELQGQFKKVDENAQKAGKGIDNAFGKLGDQFKKLGTAVVAAFAVDRIVAFGKESVAAFAEAEQSALKLRAAVSAQGGLQSDFNKLTAQAEELAGITIFDDDSIKAAQTQALQFGLNAQAVQKLIPIVADFAAAQQMDLNTALQTVIGGINGQEKALKGYGITLDGTNTRNERLIAIQEQITKTYGGTAEALRGTLGGSISEAQKAFGELQEQIGGALAPVITKASNLLTDFFTSLGNPPTQGIIEEIGTLEQLRAKLFDVNTTQEERTAIIGQLQDQYPDYLGNLNKEKATNAQLEQAINLVNAELIDQLVIKQQQLIVDEKQKKVNEARADAATLEGKAGEALAKAKAQGIVVEDKYVTLQERVARALELTRQKQSELGILEIGRRATLGSLGQELANLSDKGELFQTSLTTGYQEVKQAEKELADQQKTRADILKELGLSAQNYRRLELKALEDLVRGGDKLAQEELQRRQQKEKSIKTGLEGQTEEEKKAAADRAKNRNKELSEREKALQEAAAKEAKQTEDLRAQELKTSQEYLDLYLADQLLAIETRYNAERNAATANAQKEQQALVDQLERGLITREQYEQKKAAILAKIPATEGQQAVEIAAAELTALQARLQNLQQYTVQRQELLQQAAELETRLEAARAAKDPALVAALEQEKRVLEERLKLVADNAAERSKLEQTIAEKSAQLEQLKTDNQLKQSDTRTTNAEQEALRKQELLAKELADRRAFNEQVIALSQQLAGNLIDLGTQLSEQRIAQLEAEKETRLQDFEDQQAELTNQYEQRLIGQAQYEAASKDIANQKLKTEQDIAAKVKEIRRKEDAARKAQALFSISVDTAKAIQAQLATTPLPAGAPLVALIVASGLAQAGIVLSQKPPQYAEGVDWVPLGKNKKGRDTIPAMLDEGERVISRRKNLKHWDLYQAIDQDRLPEYVFRTYTLPALQQERDRSRQAFAELTTAVARQAEVGPTTALTAAGDPAELRRLWRRGLSINNLDELAHLLTKHQPSPYRA